MTEVDILALLHAIEKGDVRLYSLTEPQAGLRPHVEYKTGDGQWTIVLVTQLGEWDYIEQVEHRVHGEADWDALMAMPAVEGYCPSSEALWRAWGLTGHSIVRNERWRGLLGAWEPPQPIHAIAK